MLILQADVFSFIYFVKTKNNPPLFCTYVVILRDNYENIDGNFFELYLYFILNYNDWENFINLLSKVPIPTF